MSNMPLQESEFSAVIPAAGSSERMGGVDKLLADLDGMPVIARTLLVFQQSPRISEIILVTNRDNISVFMKIAAEYDITKVRELVGGGKNRQESVYNGLKRLRTKYAAIHDGARPLLSEKLLESLLDGVIGQDGCIPVIPVNDTVKIVGESGVIISTPPRESLFLAQTPQVFSGELIRKAHEEAREKGKIATDDASLMEWMNFKVRTIPGERENVKLTTQEDIEAARAFLRKRKDA